jgi:hypothetical protein
MAETKASLEAAQEGMKQRYDKKVRPLDVQPGDLVKIQTRTRRKGRKLRDKFAGPFRVVGRGEHSDNVVVVELGNGRTKHVNISSVAPFYERAVSDRACIVQA